MPTKNVTQFIAEVYHSVEGLDGEVDAAVDVPQIRQLKNLQQHFG
jgi:hypothetical protein